MIEHLHNKPRRR